MMRAAIVGGSGYTGGELLRLLHFHPDIELTQITSREHAGSYVYNVHPNMRNVSRLQFIHPDNLEACDVLFLAMPHGQAAQQIERFAQLANYIVDLSADFRLRNTDDYTSWYGEAHPAPEWLERFVYGLPELNREHLQNSHYASGVGCNATVQNLALFPLAQAGLIERVSAEIKVGSSEAGNSHTASSHHPIRSGAVRTYSPVGHRHSAEVQMMIGLDGNTLRFSVTAIEMVRGVHLLAHVDLNDTFETKDLWKLYRGTYASEPFIRLVNNRSGLHRLPEPRIVAGTNFCDIGFELDHDGRHLIVVAALDNLGKGAAGSAVQSMNLMLGLDECAGLQFPGLYP